MVTLPGHRAVIEASPPGEEHRDLLHPEKMLFLFFSRQPLIRKAACISPPVRGLLADA
jgi:hypothetical protein